MATAPTTSGSGSTVSGSGGTDTTSGAASTTGGAASTTGGAASGADTTTSSVGGAAFPTETPEQKAARLAASAAASIGAQVILDFNEDGSKGARGGAGADIVENTMARDAHLVALGLDPMAPSGPPPDPAVLKARRDAEEKAAAAVADPQFAPMPTGNATKVSSLAAGISADQIPTPPPDTLGGATA